MKKILISSIMALIILMPLSGAFNISTNTSYTPFVNTSINGNGYTNITVEEAFENYLSCYCAGIQIPIDIRRQDEWDTEHLETYGDEQKPVHWPNLHLGEGLQEFLQEYADKQVILYCRTANRTWTATKLLVANGFTGTLYHMLGGITAWKEAGYPTAISVAEAYGKLTSTSDGIQKPIDIRTEKEWDNARIDTQSPQDPVNYPNLHLEEKLYDFMTEYNDKEVIIYCDTDIRSSQAVDILIGKMVTGDFNGYMHNMIGGINAWIDAGYPIKKARPRIASFPVFQDFFERFINIFPMLRNLIAF